MNRSAVITVGMLFGAFSVVACEGCQGGAAGSRDSQESGRAVPSAVASAGSSSPSEAESAPKVLYLPDAGELPGVVAPVNRLPGLPSQRPHHCPPDMVEVRGRYCVDRYEATLTDLASGRRLSPYYHPTRAQAKAQFELYSRKATAPRAPWEVVPKPAVFQLEEVVQPTAAAQPGVIPNGYLNRAVAEQACTNAGKRLCTHEEWVTACRGQDETKYPYGDRYVYGKCNVFRPVHPAAVLHRDPSIGHLDPRLNQVREGDDPLLHVTGGTSSCRSVWGNDAIYDMVGNLDEWIAEPAGTFLGGFFARNTKQGCDAEVSSHGPKYFDYSLGTRCCADL